MSGSPLIDSQGGLTHLESFDAGLEFSQDRLGDTFFAEAAFEIVCSRRQISSRHLQPRFRGQPQTLRLSPPQSITRLNNG